MKNVCVSMLAATISMMAGAVCGADDDFLFIGTSGLGHVTPAATFPFGMVQAGPDTSAKPDRFVPDWAHTCGYQHDDAWLWRFSQTHISGTGCLAFGDFGLLPFVEGFDGASRPAKMVKNSERAVPGRYAVTIEEDGAVIGCEMTALAHSAGYRFRYPEGKKAKLLLDLDWGIGGVWKKGCWGKKVLSCACEFPTATTVRGGHEMWIWNDYRFHFSAEFSAPVVSRRLLRKADGLRGEIYELEFDAVPGGVLEMRIGLSTRSPEAAAKNLAAEMPSFDFAGSAAKSAAEWAGLLGRVRLGEGTDPSTRQSFRAAVYRTMLQPNLISDAGEPPRYSTFSLWDTFRAAHPLYTVLAGERVADFVNSMLDQYDRQGYLPIWALGGGENHCMIGHHAVPVIVDAYLKGVKGVDWARAFAAIKNSLTVNHRAVNEGTWGLMKEDWDILDRYGYYPFDLMRGEYDGQKVKGESVARVLECAYDDACAARMAKGLGLKEDAAFFTRRAGNWKNVFDPSVGFMRGKDSHGKWREPFSPYDLGSGPWRENDFCEGNSWQYTWHVMHDPEGLIAAMGGKERFTAKLCELFTTRALSDSTDGVSHDVSGLIGQYAHGNEPSHHTIYFLTLAGRQDLAAKYVRETFDSQYSARPDGLCGNDDCGQMAAWYVFSALGFYPFDPCGGEYVLGAPQVPEAEVRLPGGKSFKVVAKGLSKENLYVRSVKLNGRELSGVKLRHSELMAGGELVFEMAATPKTLPKDAIVSVKVSEVKVRGHVAEVQDRFFRERIFSDFAKNDIWKEAHDAFAHPDDDVFNHGIGMWKGEFWGKLMISASRVAEYSHDAALKEFLHEEALKLIKYQHADGYLGTYVDKEYVVPLPIEEQQRRIGWPCPWNWNLWCRKYTLWGLMSAYRLTGDRKLLDAADRAMTQQIDMLHRRNLRLCDTGTSSMHGFPPCSILKPLLWLYQDTGKAKFLDYAKEIYECFSDPSCQAVQFAAKLKTGKPLDEWYPEENGSWGKAYEMMSCLAGFVEYYRFTGDESALEVAKGMRERILTDELNLCLSVGYNDQFWCAKKRLNGVSEPCDAIHWIRLNHELYLVTGEAKYVDEIERCFYNAFLAAVRTDGKWGARCVRSHGRHQPAPPQSGMHLQHCCVNNMPRGFMDAAQTILAKDADGTLLVALYHDAEAAIDGERVEISGGYPVNDAVTVGISKIKAGKVKFRVPEWCDGLTICNDGLCMRAKRHGWFEVEAPAGKSEWKLEFGMNARIVDSMREKVDGYDKKTSRLYWRWANNSDGDGNERDLFQLLRTEPAAQVMYGPLMLAKSVRIGESADEILDAETVNCKGWRLKVDPIATESGVWGEWRLTFEKDGRSKSMKACDYSSAAIWGKKGVEFSVFF